MDLGAVMMSLYESEINCSVSTFWDNGFSVRLGDEMNGFRAQTTVGTPEEAARFLDIQARIWYPESLYALGRFEYERRRIVERDSD